MVRIPLVVCREASGGTLKVFVSLKVKSRHELEGKKCKMVSFKKLMGAPSPAQKW